MKKSIMITFLIIIILLLPGCSSLMEAKDTSMKYLSDFKDMSEEQIQKKIMPDVFTAMEDQLGIKGSKDAYQYLVRIAGVKELMDIKYDVKDFDVNGSTATMTINCKYADCAPILEAVSAEANKRGLQLGEENETLDQAVLDLVNEQIQKQGLSYKETNVKVNCDLVSGSCDISESEPNTP